MIAGHWGRGLIPKEIRQRVKPQPGRQVFGNESNGLSLTIEQMIEHLGVLTDGWPKFIAGSLCYAADEELRRSTPRRNCSLTSTTSPRAIGDAAASPRMNSSRAWPKIKRFDWAAGFPHFPSMSKVYYLREQVESEHTGALDQLVNRFRPATDLDHELIKSLIMTVFWGGPPGKRPAYTITTEPGVDDQKRVGTGKTTLAELVAKLVGGYISIRHNTSPDRVLSGLLSPVVVDVPGRHHRQPEVVPFLQRDYRVARHLRADQTDTGSTMDMRAGPTCSPRSSRSTARPTPRTWRNAPWPSFSRASGPNARLV